jgi:hypothetical protein
MKSLAAILAVIGMSAPCFAEAKDFHADRVDPINNIVECKTYQPEWVSTRSGPCSGFKPPDVIAIGETFFAMGAPHTIHLIIATQSEIDSKVDDWVIEQGDWYCVAAETQEDLEERANKRIWLLVPHCIPFP